MHKCKSHIDILKLSIILSNLQIKINLKVPKRNNVRSNSMKHAIYYFGMYTRNETGTK